VPAAIGRGAALSETVSFFGPPAAVGEVCGLDGRGPEGLEGTDGLDEWWPALDGAAVLAEHPTAEIPARIAMPMLSKAPPPGSAMLPCDCEIDRIFWTPQRHRGGQISCPFALESLRASDLVPFLRRQLDTRLRLDQSSFMGALPTQVRPVEPRDFDAVILHSETVAARQLAA
jgi:hypothetical protein